MNEKIKKFIVILIITILFIGSMIPGAAQNSVLATGRRTIKQPSDDSATHINFVVYQADRDEVYIIDHNISVNVPLFIKAELEDDWPFNDGLTHSVKVDYSFARLVPKGEKINIEAWFKLNEFNNVKFANIYWRYENSGPIEATPADTGWVIPTAPGSSPGGWTIAKFITQDSIGNTIGVDLAGHQFLQSMLPPTSQICLYPMVLL